MELIFEFYRLSHCLMHFDLWRNSFCWLWRNYWRHKWIIQQCVISGIFCQVLCRSLNHRIYSIPLWGLSVDSFILDICCNISMSSWQLLVEQSSRQDKILGYKNDWSISHTVILLPFSITCYFLSNSNREGRQIKLPGKCELLFCLLFELSALIKILLFEYRIGGQRTRVDEVGFCRDVGRSHGRGGSCRIC